MMTLYYFKNKDNTQLNQIYYNKILKKVYKQIK